jgi:hypothetical protein
MNKQLYAENFAWYNEGVYKAITALDNKYSNAIPIFGGALGAYEYINCNTPDFAKFVKCLSTVIDNAKFYKWHEGAVGAIRRFCRLCLVDPALIEAYIGITFEELCKGV